MYSKGQYLVVQADQNDGDYVTQITKISDKNLASIMPVIKAIKAFKPYSVKAQGMKWTHTHNYPKGEFCPREDLGEKGYVDLYPHINPKLLEEFDDNYVPYGENGIHSITSIDLFEIQESKNLL